MSCAPCHACELPCTHPQACNHPNHTQASKPGLATTLAARLTGGMQSRCAQAPPPAVLVCFACATAHTCLLINTHAHVCWQQRTGSRGSVAIGVCASPPPPPLARPPRATHPPPSPAQDGHAAEAAHDHPGHHYHQAGAWLPPAPGGKHGMRGAGLSPQGALRAAHHTARARARSPTAGPPADAAHTPPGSCSIRQGGAVAAARQSIGQRLRQQRLAAAAPARSGLRVASKGAGAVAQVGGAGVCWAGLGWGTGRSSWDCGVGAGTRP